MKKILNSIIGSIKKESSELGKDFFETSKKKISNNIESKTDSFLNNRIQKSTEKDIIHEAIVVSSKQNKQDLSNELSSRILSQANLLKSGNPIEALKVMNNFTDMIGDVAKYTEDQKTRRKEIEAERDKIVKGIEAERDIILFYLDKSFDERKENFKHLFKCVDQALTSNDSEKLAVFMQSINQLAARSPFQDLKDIDTTKAALNSKNHEWDF